MTIDERLGALTHTVELLAGFQQKNEQLFAQLMENMNSLARIAKAHEHRLRDLEDR